MEREAIFKKIHHRLHFDLLVCLPHIVLFDWWLPTRPMAVADEANLNRIQSKQSIFPFNNFRLQEKQNPKVKQTMKRMVESLHHTVTVQLLFTQLFTRGTGKSLLMVDRLTCLRGLLNTGVARSINFNLKIIYELNQEPTI